MTKTVFKTLKKSDADFNAYLWGAGLHVQNQTIPLPVKTLNLGEPNETVTFQIFTRLEIRRPSFWVLTASLIKLHTFVLVLMPLFYVLAKNFVDNRVRDPIGILFAAVASLLLYAGLNIRNDISDHIYGYDRVNRPKSDKPIARGWMTARHSARLSWLLILFSFLIASPAFLLEKELVSVVAVVASLIFVGQFIKKNSYKSNRLGEIILFVIAGAGLASGYQVSLGAGIDTEVLAFGVLWGVAVLFLIHVNNFSHLLTSSQAGIVNSITRMGFDKAQKFLVIWWSLFCLFWFIFHYNYGGILWTIFGTILLFLWSLPLMKQILSIRSPLSSDLDLIRKQAYRTLLMVVLFLFCEYLWSVGEKVNWTI